MNVETAKSKTIVFVEDNPVVLMAYRNRLQREGFHVEPAQDGLEALKILTRFVPDLVVLDLVLPKLSGVEVLKFICTDPRYNTVPVITLSTNSIIDTEEEYVLERANKRLIKSSCTPAIMLQAIRELLADPCAPKVASPACQPVGIQTAKAKTIVFVEDNPVVLAAYRNRLQREGFNIEPAPDGLAAMKILSRLAPDVVILDLMLPKFNGVDVLKFIRSNPRLKAVAVIILSTNSIIDTAEEYVLERANKRLLKGSCTPAIMLQAIQELLADPSASAANQSDGSQPTALKTGNVLADIKVTL